MGAGKRTEKTAQKKSEALKLFLVPLIHNSENGQIPTSISLHSLGNTLYLEPLMRQIHLPFWQSYREV